MIMIPAAIAFSGFEAADPSRGCRAEAPPRIPSSLASCRPSTARPHKFVHRIVGAVIVFGVSLGLHALGLLVAERAYEPYRIGGTDDPVHVSALARVEARRPPASELKISFATDRD